MLAGLRTTTGLAATAPGAAANANVTYAASPTAATATTVNANYAVNSLTYAAGAPAYAVTNSNNATLTIGAGGITQASANTHTLSVPTVLGAAQTYSHVQLSQPPRSPRRWKVLRLRSG